jgi:formate hydrogenlyase subunit 3/multisubunit Na+/H+ antiporter MnhD subunit
MASAQGSLSAVLVLLVLYCVPPLLCLLISLRWRRRRARHNAPRRWALLAIVFSATCLAINVSVTVLHVHTTIGGALSGFGQADYVAATLSWLCLWLTVIVAYASRRRLRRMIYW